MTQTLTMEALYSKLVDFGIPKKYVKEKGLPSWWNNELDNKPVAVLECSGYIADRFGLDLKSLISEKDIKFRSIAETKFKQRGNNPKSEIAHGLAHRFAEMIADGCEIDFTPLPNNNVGEIRQEILEIHQTINLTSLIDYCWRKGIAIAYFNTFPKNQTKFDGMIQWHNKRPVIVISVNYKESARLAFVLAHELGHLVLKHITQDCLFDDKIEYNTDGREEKEANQFAVELLLGDLDNCLENKKFKNAKKLIEETEAITVKRKDLDKSSVILNYGWHNKKYFPLAIKALNELKTTSNDNISAPEYINKCLADKLDWDRFDDDNYEYLEQVLGV